MKTKNYRIDYHFRSKVRLMESKESNTLVPVMPPKEEPVGLDTIVEYIRASVSYHSGDAVTPNPLRACESELREMLERFQALGPQEDDVDRASVLITETGCRRR